MTSPQKTEGTRIPGPAIEVAGLTKTYPERGRGVGRRTVLSNLDFTVPTGTVVSFLGHNGAGKTTLVRILSTLLHADSGTVRVFGNDLKENSHRVRRDIAVTGQFAAVDEHLTGRENLEFFGRLRGLDRATTKSRAKELLDQFSLTDAADKFVENYSGGMRRRLDIAVSLCVVPRLLFLDEPTTGLDPVSREQLWDYIRTLRSEGMTLVLTTQYLEEAEALADRVCLLKDSRIVASGTPDELRLQLGSHVLTASLDSDDDASRFARSLRRAGLGEPQISGRSLTCDIRPGPDGLEVVAHAMRSADVVPENLSVSPPSLNEVFIAMNTGEHRTTEGPQE